LGVPRLGGSGFPLQVLAQQSWAVGFPLQSLTQTTISAFKIVYPVVMHHLYQTELAKTHYNRKLKVINFVQTAITQCVLSI
jgi:hypothetical protein